MLFGLSAADRAELRGRHPAVSKRIERLTKDEPRLLVSILMGNTIINCLFFVITSAILLQADLGAAWSAGVATGLLLILVVVGEIIPKALCDVARVSAAVLLSGPLLVWTKLAGPVAAAIERTIVEPLARLSGSEAEQDPDAGRRALRTIVEQAAADRVLQSGEAEMLSELMSMPSRRVRDAMTPRLRMPMLSHDATRAEAARLLSQQQTPLVTVIGEGPDDVIGFLHAKRFLHRELPTVGHPSALQPVRAIPETATLEDALQAFKRTGSRALIVVDEFGGTEGVLTIEMWLKNWWAICGTIDRPTWPQAPRRMVLGRFPADAQSVIWQTNSTWCCKKPNQPPWAATWWSTWAESPKRVRLL